MPPPRSRLVLFHGFAQTDKCWIATPQHAALWAQRVEAESEIVTPIIPGHGYDPGPLDPQATLWTVATQLVAAQGAGTYLGYSFGGRVAVHAALQHPECVQRLVLVSATPGLADAVEREARRRADSALAERIERIGVPAFIEEWLAQPMFEGLSPSARFLAERSRNTAAGLAWALRRLGTGSQHSLWERLAELSMPVLVITGTQDQKFDKIGDQMCNAIGSNATRISIEGAGHSAHLEQPERFTEVLSEWLGQS